MWKETPYEKNNNSSDATCIAREDELLQVFISKRNLRSRSISSVTEDFLCNNLDLEMLSVKFQQGP